ncbi:CPBP family glutamic-type intramembrane protease [Brachybacterium sp. DNPG3]
MSSSTPAASPASTPAPPASSSPSPASAPAPAPPGRAVPSARRVLLFAAIALAIMAACAAPFWVLDEGIAHPLYTPLIAVAMLAPTVASVIVAKAVDRTSWRDAVGLRFRGRWGRILLWAPLALLIMLGINLASAVIMVLRGVPGDLSGGTWAAEITRVYADAGLEMPTAAAVGLTLAISLVGVLITVVPALGEEIGWRGWLWRELRPLGAPTAIVLGGTIWSLWHLPIVLIGHNYTGSPRWAAVLMFIPACIALNHLFVAITRRAGGNPIPAAFAHATLNSTVGLALSIVATSATADRLNMFIDTPLGVIGIALVALAGFLVWPRRAVAEDDAREA